METPKVPKLPGWAKILLGASIAGVILWKAPVVEIATLFFYIVLIPLAFLGAVGLVSQGTLQTFSKTFNQTMEQVKQKVEEQRKKLKDKPSEEAAA